tara:strand:- start:773 stop:1183 length:411 start_codon:yes stop_codon:yes gene_type:complete
MKVNKESLVKLIELVVKREIKSAINEIKQSTAAKVIAETKPVKQDQKQSSIKQALEETYSNKNDWESLNGDKPFDSSRMGQILNKQYGDMGPGQPAQVDIATATATEENVAADAIPDALKNALNKDYSELVKRFDK